ncbi:MAG TPA: hypothetical protein VIH99_05025 [Bdellovibrionota bacterium]
MKHILLVLGFLAAIPTSAFALTVKEAEVVNKVREVSLQQVRLNEQPATILADASGMSVYTFDLDSEGKSVCQDSCLVAWPPLRAPADGQVPAPFGKIQGNDGKPQLTLKGLPLYYYFKDKKPGDVLGNYPKWRPVLVVK